MSKLSFKTLANEDATLNKQTKIKVEWKPIEIQKEEIKPPVVRKSGLKSLKEVYHQDLDVAPEQPQEQPKEEPVNQVVGSKFTLIEETTVEDKVEEKILEEVEITAEEVVQNLVEEKTKTIVEKVAEFIANDVKLHEQDSFQQPNPPSTNKNIDDVVKKIKSLESWISRIAVTGPGGGDANPHDQIEFLERGVRFTPTPRMMYWNKTEDCLNIEQADGTTLQVGLENYIRVFNNTGNVFSNGTFVEFTGVDSDGDAPTFRAYVNDANALPLYNIGVLTTDVASNTHGRATVLGLVRGLDTTGNAVGEVWAPGDILWASPSYPGNYTKFKPTAPNVALSVAAVTVSDPTEGIILVRPTVWPRLQYGDFYRQTGLVAPASDTDVTIPFSNTLFASGFVKNGNSIIALNSGLYKFDARAQLKSTSSNEKNIAFWFKKNGTNIPYSAVRQSVAINGGFSTISNTQLISLTPGDNVTIHFAVTDTALFIDSPAILDGSPNVPAVQLTVIEAAL